VQTLRGRSPQPMRVYPMLAGCQRRQTRQIHHAEKGVREV